LNHINVTTFSTDARRIAAVILPSITPLQLHSMHSGYPVEAQDTGFLEIEVRDFQQYVQPLQDNVLDSTPW